MSAIRRMAASPHLVALAGVVLVGAILRFATIDLQSYRYDEAVTVGRVLQPSLFATLATVPHSESTPPLYYLARLALGAAGRDRRDLDAVALGAGGDGLDRRRLPRRPRPAAAAPVGPDRGGGGRRQPGADLVLTGRPLLRAGLPADRSLLSLLRQGAPRRRAFGPGLVGSVLGSGDRDPLLRRLRGRRRGAAADPRGQPAPRRDRGRRPRRHGRAAGPDRPPADRQRPRRLDRRTAARPTDRTRGSEVGRGRQRRRTRSSAAWPDPSRRSPGARPRRDRAAALARGPRRAPGRPGRGAGRRPRRGDAAPARPARCRLLRRAQPAAGIRAAVDSSWGPASGSGAPAGPASPWRGRSASARSSSPSR